MTFRRAGSGSRDRAAGDHGDARRLLRVAWSAELLMDAPVDPEIAAQPSMKPSMKATSKATQIVACSDILIFCQPGAPLALSLSAARVGTACRRSSASEGQYRPATQRRRPSRPRDAARGDDGVLPG